MLVKLENKALISIFSCFFKLINGGGKCFFEKTVHTLSNDYSVFSARHCRPFLSSVFSSDFCLCTT